MELTFVQQSGKYVAEFEAAGDFNLHVEKPYGPMWISQRTAGTKWDRVKEIKGLGEESTFDYDFTALVYPKFIKIECEVEPTLAVVVSSGEITEIKSQSKEIEITSNGTTSVEPDAGFAYLSKVNIKTNVPQNGEGGGSGEGEGGSRIEYMDMRGIEGPVRANLLNYSLYIKANIASAGLIVAGMPVNPLTSMGFVNEDALALAIDFSQEVGMLMGETMQSTTVAQAVLSNGVTQEQIDALPRITESEFYNLEA